MNADTLKSYPPEQRCFYLLGLKPGATREDVREAYRRLNLRYHPDRPGGGDPNKFLLISKAYAEAVQVLEKGQLTTNSARTHEELRAAAAQQEKEEEKRVFQTLDPKNFNVKKFNEAFESFHIQEPWMRGGYEVETGGPREDQPEIRMRPELQAARTPDAFRRAFEQELREKQGNLPRDLILFQDPLPIGGGVGGNFAGAGGWTPAGLGDCTDDFTDDGRYTDYLKAHTVYNTCTPSLDLPVPERTLESYKAERERSLVPLSDDERKFLEMREQERLQAEERRLQRMREYDAESHKRYLESHKLMLGHEGA